MFHPLTSSFNPLLVAPEMLEGKPHTMAVDWYAFGLLIWELLAGAPPFVNTTGNVSDVYDAITAGPPPFPRHFSEVVCDLLSGLLERCPEKRLGSRPGDDDIAAIKQHRYFAGVDWDAVYARSLPPPWRPELHGTTDTSNFDGNFTSAHVDHLGTSHGSHLSARSYASANSLPMFEGFSYGSVARLGTSVESVASLK